MINKHTKIWTQIQHHGQFCNFHSSVRTKTNFQLNMKGNYVNSLFSFLCFLLPLRSTHLISSHLLPSVTVATSTPLVADLCITTSCNLSFIHVFLLTCLSLIPFILSDLRSVLGDGVFNDGDRELRGNDSDRELRGRFNNDKCIDTATEKKMDDGGSVRDQS